MGTVVIFSRNWGCSEGLRFVNLRFKGIVLNGPFFVGLLFSDSIAISGFCSHALQRGMSLRQAARTETGIVQLERIGYDR